MHGCLHPSRRPFNETGDRTRLVTEVCAEVLAAPAGNEGVAVERFIGELVEFAGDERGAAPDLQEGFLQVRIGGQIMAHPSFP